MKLQVRRKWFTERSTAGELWIDDEFFCYTLEDAVRDEKIKGETAIPYGTYKLIIDFSNRFQKMMPHVLDVPGFEGIRIHAGNTDKDTEGCLLLGMNRSTDFVGSSRIAFSSLMEKLNGKDNITIEYIKES